MRQVSPGPRQMAPRQFQGVSRQAMPSQRISPKSMSRIASPKGELRRGVNPRTGIARDGIARSQGMGGQGIARQGMGGGSRAAARRDMREQASAKSKLTGREAVRQRSVERRQQLIENRQAAGKARERLRANLKGDRVRDAVKAGNLGGHTVGARTAGAERGLVRRGQGDRQLMLRNRALAERSARTPAARALAQATFGGRYADRFRDGDRRHWHHRHHRHIHVIGWLGPVFWPYAYDDFVDYTYWPYAYDAFWPYAYDDVYDGFFGPYGVGGPAYTEAPAGDGAYVGGGGGVRTGTRTGAGPRTAARGSTGSGSSAMAQICTGETSGLTDWPVERIAQTVNPDETQRATLNELRDATARAVKLMRSACPDDLPSTPAGRMAAMRQRLEAMREAVQIVRPALETFYGSLSDEQKARFNALEPEQTAATDKTAKAELSQVCSTAVTKTNAAPTARIRETLRLTAEQRTALDNLDHASAQAAEMLTANCPSDETLTPPGRLAAMDARLDAMLKALDVVQPALVDFYGALTDEQKARFNQLGVRRQAGR
ncbi:MAG TPA: Spy/CpxP family protein refolding chaperone [Xanthobacteraceae bacterium]|nr:Spy/CpxP family protein refolding chaperone [Xanthobacteraceae bacterium]